MSWEAHCEAIAMWLRGGAYGGGGGGRWCCVVVVVVMDILSWCCGEGSEGVTRWWQ